VHDLETPDERRALAQRLMTGLRLSEGVPLEAVEPAAESLGLTDALEAALRPHVERGWLERAGGALRCTDEGLRHADGIAADAIVSLI